ncbi:low temperature requirement protein A [Agromyces ramosus]|nr:low temperature requirement protein A [Agromyces ramosus]
MSGSDPVVEYVRPHGLRRMLGRDPREAHRPVTPLELLFDLTFVVSFSQAGDQLAHYVAEAHIATAVWGFAFVLLSVCWAWINFTWFASAFDTDDWLQRVLTMVQMVGVIVLALGIPAVFKSIDSGGSFDFVLVAVGYVIMRVSLVLMWLRVAGQDPANRRVALRYAGFNVLIQAAWLTVALLRIEDGPVLVAVLVVLWLAEFAGHPFATWNAKAADGAWQGTPWHAGHIAERYGLLVIITLGEGILGTIAAVAAVVAHVGWSSEAVLIVVSGTGLTFGLWWTYFILPSAPVLARHRERKWAWGYGHIVVFGALAAVGAGLHVAAYAAEGETKIGTVGVVMSVAIPVLVFSLAYFVLWSILFRAVDAFHVMLAAGMAAFLVVGVLLATVGVPLGWCLLVVTLSPFVVAVGYETAGYRHVEADVRRES